MIDKNELASVSSVTLTQGETPPSAKPLTLDYQRIGRSGKVRLTARLPDESTYTDKVDVADADGRARYLRGLCKGRKGIDRKTVEFELEKIAGEVVSQPQATDNDKDEERSGPSSQADLLVELAESVELFHTPGGHDSEGYATLTVGNHRETWPVNSKGFRRWLARQYYQQFNKTPGSQAIQDALNVIAGKAIHEGHELSVEVRLAEHDGAIWLDLADGDWRAVEVRPGGWRVVAGDAVPVRFVRKRGMLPIPIPVIGGRIDELRQFVNLPLLAMWVLFVAWLIAALRPRGPYTELCVNGEQGSAKSTLCRVARLLLDPNKALLRRPPREERDLIIAATNGWIVAFDNLSGIPATLSDALCALATGSGFSTRELYTDDGEKLFDAMRPVIVNGIDDLAVKSDMLDRAVTLTLPTIPEGDRRDEAEFWIAFEQARPRILGALLDGVSAAMKNLPAVKLDRLPRMADFAKWVVAAEPALGWKEGTFMAAYTGNREAAHDLAIECSPIGAPILLLIETRKPWYGISKDLLADLGDPITNEMTRKRLDWPKTPKKLSNELHRLAPNLRAIGINVTFGTRTRHGTPITIEQACKQPSPPTRPSPTISRPGESASSDGDAGELTVQPLGRHAHGNIRLASNSDGGDGNGGQNPASSSPTTVIGSASLAQSDLEGDRTGGEL